MDLHWESFGQMRHSPMYAAWSQVAPDPGAFPALMDKTGDLQRRDYDRSAEVAELGVPTLLAYGDADSIPPAHAAEFFALLGGGLRDPGWEASARPPLAPGHPAGLTHYDIFASPRLAEMAAGFLG